MKVFHQKTDTVWQKLERRFLSSRLKSDDLLYAWRERIVFAMSLICTVLGFLALIPSVWLALKEGLWSVAILDICAWLLVLTVLLSRKVPLGIRAGIVIFLFYFLGLGLCLFLGPYGAGYIWLFAFSVFAGGLLGTRIGLMAVALNAGTMILVGILADQGVLAWAAGMENATEKWLVTSASFILLNTVTAVSTSMMLGGMESALHREKSAKTELEDKHQRLTEANQRLVEEMQVRGNVEEALRHSEAQYRLLAENVTDLIWTAGMNSIVTYMSPSVEKVLGYSVEEIVGHDLGESLSLEARERVKQITAEVFKRLEQNENVPFDLPTLELEHVKKDGTGLWAEIKLNFLTDANGRVEGVIGITRDIEERKKSQQELSLSEARYRNLFNRINDMICSHDMEGRLINVNPIAAHVLGYTTDQMVGILLPDLLEPKYRQEFHNDYLERIKEHGQADGIMKMRDTLGGAHYIEYKNVLVETEEGEPYVTGVGRDITERIAAERKMKKLQQQLQQSQKMEAIGTLASGIAHDFNNVLAIIMGYSELVANNLSTDHAAMDNVNQIITAANRAKKLVRQILTFSRKADKELVSLDINKCVREASMLIKHAIPKMIEINLDLAPGIKPFQGDERQIEQMIMNLWTNAADAMPEGGGIAISTRNITLPNHICQCCGQEISGDHILLEVSDTGMGINKENLDKIFDPFFTTKPIGQGTGLGLSMVYGIVTSHGGHILCRSVYGQGATFSIYMPVHEADPSLQTNPGSWRSGNHSDNSR